MTGLRIVSGGQTGVDRAALDAALLRGASCGGWCPAGRRAEDGPIADRYPLTEMASSDYIERTVANARDSDATLILCYAEFTEDTHSVSAGTTLTAEAAKNYNRPLFIARLVAGAADAGIVKDITAWIREHRVAALNIAGPRESECPGIYASAYALILALISEVLCQ